VRRGVRRRAYGYEDTAWPPRRSAAAANGKEVAGPGPPGSAPAKSIAEDVKERNMTDVKNLMSRIDAEFAASEKKTEEFRTREVQDYKGRQERLERFGWVCDQLRDVWRPRLEALAERFKEQVSVTPKVSPSRREAEFGFKSNLANIVLKFSASTDLDVRKLVLNCDLRIIPILMRFEPHAEAEFPLEDIDSDAVGSWIDDRIVEFVRTYLDLHQNQYYLKGHMVEDPVSGTRFPKFAAAASRDWNGKTYFFISAETCEEFERKHKVART
jgi:YHS domain-containing protein